MKRILFLMVLVLFLIPLASALEYNNEVIKQSPTDFEWCFTPEWEDAALYKDKLELYVDNFGCEVTSKKLYAVTPVIIKNGYCKPQPDECVDNSDYANESYNLDITCTPQPDVCVDKVVYEKYDLEKTDYLFPKGSRVCYEATRKADSSGNCDMNFRTEVDGEVIDVKDDGKAWWNQTWLYKIQVNFTTNVSANGTIEWDHKLTLNSTVIDYGNTNNDGSDLRCVNGDENETFPIFVSHWNESGTSVVYCKVPLNASTYLYYGNAAASSADSYNNTFDSNKILMTDFADNTTTDLSDHSQSMNSSGNVQWLSNDTDIRRNPGYYKMPLSSVIEIADSDDLEIVGAGAIMAWVNVDAYDGSGTHIGSRGYWTAGCEGNTCGAPSLYLKTDGSVACGGVGLWEVDTSAGVFTQYLDTWTHLACVSDGTSVFIYINGVQVHSETPASTYVALSSSVPMCIGRLSSSGGCVDTDNELNGFVDSFQLYDRSLNTTEMRLIAGWGVDVSYGAEEANLATTTLETGLFDEDYNDISNTTGEGQEFIVWANYTYDVNSTAINDTVGFCNYSADNVYEEQYDDTPGTNTTVCTAGCDYTNRTGVFTGLDTDGYINDVFRFRLCHNGGLRRNYFVGTSCGSNYEFGFATLPLCSAGWLNFTITDANCSGVADVNLSIWSAGTNTNQALRLVDDFVGVDRFHNHTGNMTFNATSQLWISDEEHEYYEHGNRLINVSCFENLTGSVQNQTVLINVTVVNIPPVNILSSIWTWFDGLVAFTPSVSVRYPLQSTLNISGVCFDDDLQNITLYLNFTNGTNIDTFSFNASPPEIAGSRDYTQANFSTNLTYLDGDASYTFQSECADSTNNITIVSRAFTAENDVPTIAWTNSSPLSISSVPAVLNWTCTDLENETTTSYLYINNTNMSVPNQTGGTGYLFNLSENTWNLSVRCADGFRNGSVDELVVSYMEACDVNLTGITDGDRFADNNLGVFSVNCSNLVAVTNCGYRINDFAFISLDNCTSFNVSAEKGMNRFNFTVNQGLLSQGSSTLTFWAKKYDSSILDYPVILFLILIAFLFAMIAFWTRVGIIHFVSGCIFAYSGYELLAFSTWGGYLTIIGGLLYGVVMVILSLDS